MKVLSATKNISDSCEGYGVIIKISGEDECWIASFEEDVNHNVVVDAPIKIMYKQGETKQVWKSFKEFNLTNEIVILLDNVIEMFNRAPEGARRVLL